MIEVSRLYKSFESPVLRGVQLRAERAQLLGLIGPPASGKSVLLRAMAGLVEVEAGSIRVRGQELVGADPETIRDAQGHIGMLFQNVALFDHLNVFENVAFPLRRLARIEKNALEERVLRELAAVGLEHLHDHMPRQLSGGQKRRVGLARAAITSPRVLLYDEPAAGLDPVTTSRTFLLLKEQQRRIGAALIVVSSDIDRLLPVCNQVALMYRGRILFQGTEPELRSVDHPVVRQFLSGDNNGPL